MPILFKLFNNSPHANYAMHWFVGSIIILCSNPLIEIKSTTKHGEHVCQSSKISAMPNDWSIYEKSCLIGFQVYNGGLNQIWDEFQSLLRTHPPTGQHHPLSTFRFPLFGICPLLPQTKSQIKSSKLVKVRSWHILLVFCTTLTELATIRIGATSETRVA